MSDKNKGEPDGQSPQPVPNFDYSSGAAELRGDVGDCGLDRVE